MCYFCFIKWIASLNYIIKAKNAPLIFKNNSKYISFLIHDSAFNYCPGPFVSFFPSLTVSLYADSINGAKLPKKFLPNVHNVKINEFVIGCCTKKNYFLISAQPSKNLPSSRNKTHTHRRKWTERQRRGKVTLRMKFSLLPASLQPSRKSGLEQTGKGARPGSSPQASSFLPSQGPWDPAGTSFTRPQFTSSLFLLGLWNPEQVTWLLSASTPSFVR